MKGTISTRFIGPSDNHPLSKDDFKLACLICDEMVGLRASRKDYLVRRDMDPSLYLPGHVWAQEFCPTNFAIITNKDYHTLNHLRLLTQNFTGFRLLDMKLAENAGTILEIPKDVDGVVRSHAPKVLPFVESFLRSVSNLPSRLVVSPPRIMGESGWEVGGVVINYDTWATQQRINALYCSGALDLLEARAASRGYCRVLEIGAGYGNLGYSLARILEGRLEYTIVDLPESLVYSACYLGVTLPGLTQHRALPGHEAAWGAPGFHYVANHLLEENLERMGQVDLAINMLSLSEMSPEQVAFYARHLQRLLGSKGVFLEQNYYKPGFHTDAKAILADHFPYHRRLDETVAPHSGRGDVDIWANRYMGEVFDRSDILAWPKMFAAPPASPAHEGKGSQ